MDQLTKLFEAGNTNTSFTLTEILLRLLLAFFLTALIAFIYKVTYQGVAYNKSLSQSLVMLGMLISVVMAIVGTNIATAFTLVGALSIVRFRNAVKETRDVGFIFFAMVIGMSVGSAFYVLAAVATFVICLVVVVMYRFDWFDSGSSSHVLKVQFPTAHDPESSLKKVFDSQTKQAQLISVETVRGGALVEYTYSVTLESDASIKSLISAVSKLDQSQKVNFLTGFDQTSL